MTHGISWLESTGVLVREVTFALRLRVNTAQTVHLSQLIYNQTEYGVPSLRHYSKCACTWFRLSALLSFADM